MNAKVSFDRQTSQYIYVLVRTDLPLEHQAPQAIHAAMKASQTFPLQGEERLVFLGIEDQENLLKMKTSLDIRNIPYEEFHEPDYNHGLTSLCTAPIPSCPLFKKLKLWQPATNETKKFHTPLAVF